MSIAEIRKLKELLESEIKLSSKVFIIGHNNPDFDSIGSCIGLFILARHYYKEAYIIVDNNELPIEPGVRRILDENKETLPIIKKSDYLELATPDSLLIVADVNKDYMIAIGDSLDRVGNIILIDHHTEDSHTIPTNKKLISTKASSASEIVARVLGLSRLRYPKSVANYLLAGISLDTHRFKQNTTSITHDVAEKLINRGADIDYVNSLFLEEFDSYCRINDLIINGTFFKNYGDSILTPIHVSFTVNNKEPEKIYLKEDFAKAADKMMKFDEVDASFAFGFVEKGIIHISARGGKRVNVGKVMQYMGGGGNDQSAGGRIVHNNLDEVTEKLMNAIPIGISIEEQLKEETENIKVKQLKR